MVDMIFAPTVPLFALWGVAALVVAMCSFALWRGLPGWPMRLLAGLVLLVALATPSLKREDKATLTDIALILVDETSSQTIADRPVQTAGLLEQLKTRLADRGNTDVRVIRITDAAGDGGSPLLTALRDAVAGVPANRLAGVFVLTDGAAHDGDIFINSPAPVHVLLSGQPDDWDRRLVVENAPAFGILGEPLKLTLRIEDQGAAPPVSTVPLDIAVDGAPAQRFTIALGPSVDVELQLPHGGMNVLQLSTPMVDGELTDRNNAAVLRINAVRDRLRVLLVSGEPHAGERTWRNLLKSDPSVDLVHFTILKPPGKQGGVPVNELSLIAFPTRELFLEKIDEFDLIIFDRYRRRAILPSSYFANMARYVRDGGGILIAAGPDFAGVDSIARTALADVIPAVPTVRIFEEPILPAISDLGARHPVTQGLAGDTPWGRWLRQIEVQQTGGDVLLTGKNDRPLLMVDRVGQGRVALLASDHAWLWDRGFEGGGPQRELLRRLAHWMMQEPDLEEEALTATETDVGLEFTRRTLSDAAPAPLNVTGP
ncbi:MAG: glutamine amidotransferase, partial [Pseudomonadota bacterium]